MVELEEQKIDPGVSVAVIVLGYNDLQWLDRCLGSLVAVDCPGLRVIYVDNASTDGSVVFVRDRFPNIEIIASEKNLGFAGGNNLGIQRALEIAADYLVLLNSDTWVEPDWLVKLLAGFRETGNVGAVTSSIRTYDGDTADKGYTQILSSTPDFIRDSVIHVRRPFYETWTGSGAALALSQEFIEKVGMIDPVFFMYYEEIDWLRRGRLHGFTTLVSTEAIVHHFNHLEDPSQTKPSQIRSERGFLIYVMKNHEEILTKSVAKFLFECISRISGALLKRQWKRSFQLAKISLELSLKLPRILWRRQLELKRPSDLPEMIQLEEAASR